MNAKFRFSTGRVKPLSPYKKKMIARKIAELNPPSIAGIYMMSFGSDCYIGQSVKIRRRIQAHILEAHYGLHANRHLRQRLSAKEVWSLKILEAAPNLSRESLDLWLRAREAFWIDFYRATMNVVRPAIKPLSYDKDLSDQGLRRLNWELQVERQKIRQNLSNMKIWSNRSSEIGEAISEAKQRLKYFESRSAFRHMVDFLFFHKHYCKLARLKSANEVEIAALIQERSIVDYWIRDARSNFPDSLASVGQKEKRFAMLMELKGIKDSYAPP